MLFEKLFKNEKVNLLKLVDYHDPILRKETQAVVFPLSEDDKQLIADMKYSIEEKQLKKANAPFPSAAGMAANQWGKNKQIFIYCPTKVNNTLEVMINPWYEPILNQHTNEEDQYESAWEGCFSVPLVVGNVKRFKHIKAYYQNEQGEHCERELTGYLARVFQHETDHIKGFLYDDPRAGKCLEKHQFKATEALERFYTAKKEEQKLKEQLEK